MSLKALTPDLSVSPQIGPADLSDLARGGFKAIIGNRPDGEAPDQPRWEELAAAARQHGMQARQIPVVASQIDESDLTTFREALRDLPKPILAFCRTGTRSTMLWALADEGPLSTDERIRVAAAGGYELEPLRHRIQAKR